MRCSHRASAMLALLLALCCAIGEGTLSAAGPTTLYLPTVSAGPVPTPTLDPGASMEGRIADLINAVRVDHGLAPLALSVELAGAARLHSADMAANAFFDHVGSDGSTPGDRMEAAGYPWYACGEIIAAGYASAEEVVDGWMGSEGHREAILCTLYQDMGVGYVHDATSVYGRYYTVDFAALQGQ